MQTKKQRVPSEIAKKRILYHATNSFLQNGYTDTYLKDLAEKADLNIGSLLFHFPHKQDILLALVDYVIAAQFSVASTLIRPDIDDPAYLYVVDTALEMHMAESAEHLRDLYLAAYTIPQTANLIYSLMTPKIEKCFGRYNPRLKTKDFYQLQIGSAAMMRGYLSIPCTKQITIKEKLRHFHESALRMYRVPPRNIRLLLNAVQEYDFDTIARQSVQRIRQSLNA